MSNHVLDWKEIFRGRGHIEIPPQGLVTLAHLAGAPWSIDNPDAKLSQPQIEILTAPERVVVVFGGSRAGKSVIGACAALGQLMVPNSRTVLVAANYEHASKEYQYIWDAFRRLFGDSAILDGACQIKPPHYAMRLESMWRSTVSVVSTMTQDGAQLLGSEFDLAILCESSHISADVYYRKLERALLGRAKKSASGYVRRTGRAFLLTTPRGLEGVNYALYARAMERTHGNLDKLRLANGCPYVESLYFAQRSVVDLNPAYPIETFNAARRSLPPEAFAEQYEGRAIARSGRVYGAFREPEHLLTEMPSINEIQTARIGVGIDTGRNFAAILVAQTTTGKFCVLGEVFNVEHTTQSNAESVLEMVEETLRPYFDNPKDRVDLWVIDVHSQHIEDFTDMLNVYLDAQQFDVLNTLSKVDVMFQNDELYIHEDCTFTLHEIRNLRWKESSHVSSAHNANTGPDRHQGADHCLDALRYTLMHMVQAGPPEVHTPALTFDQVMEKSRNDLLSCDLKRDIERVEQAQIASVWRNSW